MVYSSERSPSPSSLDSLAGAGLVQGVSVCMCVSLCVCVCVFSVELRVYSVCVDCTESAEMYKFLNCCTFHI